MLKELLEEEARYLRHFFDNLKQEEAEAAFDLCLRTEGSLILTGIGKSGIIAEKIAMTLISTGTKALYLPASNFLHGDIGILSEKDTLLLFSKSGETEELLYLLPFAQKRGAKTLAIVSHAESRLARFCTESVTLPVERELCPFNLAPTTSTLVQLLFGDALAMALMRAKGVTLATYGDNHPSGSIGKKLKLKVEEVMLQGDQIPLCDASAVIGEVLSDLTSKKCGCLVVADEAQELQGIFTDGDLRRSLQSIGSSIMEEKIGALMTRSALSIPKGALAWEAMQLMQRDPKKWIMVLPVTHEGKVVGLLRMHDIIQAGISL